MNNKSWKTVYISCAIWVIICGLFSLCGKEYYLYCLLAAGIFVVLLLICAIESDYKEKYRTEIEAKKIAKIKQEQEKAEQFKFKWLNSYKPLIKVILRSFVAIMTVLLVISGIKTGISSFVDNYGLVPFLLLLILLFK